jgi:methylenetetrahydrofolate reductase (NADPH)
MVQADQPWSTATPSEQGLKERIVRFLRRASTEITPSDAKRLPGLAALLPPGTAVYVAHPPNATLDHVVQTALAVQRAGFTATPHIVARRIVYPHTLRIGLAQLRAGGVEQILLVAGDAQRASGEFNSTLDILASGLLDHSGLARIAVAGHPEGHKALGAALLWEALKTKQAFSERTGIKMQIVTQFGFNANAIEAWERELVRHEIRLPVCVGIAGPTPLSKLIKFAMQCGIGASLRTVIRNLSAVGSYSELAITPDQHVMRLMQLPATSPIVAPHFFSFGGALDTARWISQVAAGAFEIDATAQTFRIEN